MALVSVIIATYNRSNALAYSIHSVLAQSFQDWELLVIGDACSDDSEAVVAAFKDPRIRFVNLSKNYGNQYGPNNHGMKLAQGRFIAFLNHDDLWWPDHLATALSEIESSDADLVFTIGERLEKKGIRRLTHAAHHRTFQPYLFIPCSLWLFKKELHRQIGDWKDPHTLYNFPSHDWICRAHKARKNLRAIPRLTALLIPGGCRKNVYANREYRENEECLEKILGDTQFREKELSAMAANRYAHPLISLRWTMAQVVKRLIHWAGFEPLSFHLFFLFPGRGGFVKRLKKVRGLQDHEKPGFDPS